MSANPNPVIEFPQPRPFQRQGQGYRYVPPGLDLTLTVERLAAKSDELSGELLIESNADGVTRHVHRARANLLSTRSRSELANYLDRHSGLTPLITWAKIMESFFTAVVESERKGEPFVMAGKGGQRPVPLPDMVELLLPSKQATTLFGPGGSGKSYIGIGICAAVSACIDFAGLRVMQAKPLYLDWEDNLDRFEERLWKVSQGMGLAEPAPVAYRVCRGPMKNQLFEIARYIDGEGINLIAVDSVGKACGSSGDHGTYESVAATFFETLSMFGPVTSLLIDHVDGNAVRNGERANKAFGSVMKLNWVRMAWEVMSQQDLGSGVSRLGLYHAKTNHTGKHDPLAFSLDFSDQDVVRITRDDIYEMGGLAEKVSMKDRIINKLKHGAMSAGELASDMGVTGKDPSATVRVILNRHKDRFVQTGDARWELLGLIPREAQPTTGARQATWDEDTGEPETLPF